MNQAAFLLENTTIYWYSIILALAVLAGVCFYLACCAYQGIPMALALTTALVGAVVSMLLSRLLYWYCRPSTFDSAAQALTSLRSDAYALAGAFAGCGLTTLVMGRQQAAELLDSMSVGGCAAIALGRLGNFTTTADRGQILLHLRGLPWASPVMSAASGAVEYRLATFVLQSIVAGVLFLVLAAILVCRKNRRAGDLTILFVLVYSASQIVLDSTRYDALHLRSNGFINMAQLLAAIALAACFVILAVRAVQSCGMNRSLLAIFLGATALLGGAGYMEYYVQRHARLAVQSYAVMGLCLLGILALSLTLWSITRKKAVRLP